MKCIEYIVDDKVYSRFNKPISLVFFYYLLFILITDTLQYLIDFNIVCSIQITNIILLND